MDLYSGIWHGEWENKTHLYGFRLNLHVRDGNNVEGSFVWTLYRTNRAREQKLVGHSGTEFLRGHYTPATRELYLKGYSKNDPDGIVGIAEYRLSLSEDGMIMSGVGTAAYPGADPGRFEGRFIRTES